MGVDMQLARRIAALAVLILSTRACAQVAEKKARTLYMTARTGLYRMRLGREGVRPPLASASR
jgi:hypothetical protein